MDTLNLKEIAQRSKSIRRQYHNLEKQYHGSEWTVEEDALAFLTDAALVGRLTMSQQGRWPKADENNTELTHKLGECIWWITVLAQRMDIDIEEAVEKFLNKTEGMLEK